MSNFNDFKKIKIPIIQRDYVQAREGDEKANEVIEKFLDDLYTALTKEKEEEKKFHLDFVYGYEKDGVFIPIDGQQRLTTLFLIHWYYAKTEGKKNETILTYETRVSSREFCDFLLNIELENNTNLSIEIINNKKFNPYWSDDPTIKSMLKVLDKIEKKQKEKPIKYEDLKYISFEKFDMVDFGEIQAEELYRKMNSRGKALTAFENFKSIYEKIAYSVSKDMYRKIAVKFEKDWIGSFWVDDDIKAIDDNIINFIYFLTEMRLYETQQTIPENVKSFKFLEEFWSIQENFEFFEKVFDNLEAIKASSKSIKENLVFFDTDEKADLFMESIATKKINIVHKTMLYVLIWSVLTSEDNVHVDLMRIVRNVLNINSVALRAAGKISYDQTLSIDVVINLLPSLKKVISDNPYETILKIEDKKLEHEQKKARLMQKYKSKIFKLEDYKYIKGDLRLLLDVADIETIYKYIIVDGIFEKENLNKTLRAILSCDDYGFWIGNVKGGDKYFYGSEGYMEIFLTKNNKSESIKKTLKAFFTELQEHTQDTMIENYLRSSQVDWRYYFVKYPEALESSVLSNVFGWMQWKEEKEISTTFIDKLEKHTAITKRHINIYIYILLKQLQKDIDFDCIEFDEESSKTLNYNSGDISVVIEEGFLRVNGEKFALFENSDAIENITKKLF